MDEEAKKDIRIEQLDHVGIAVESINQALSLYHGLFGMNVERIEEVESEQVRVASLDAGNTVLELLEPLNDDGPIQKFLDQHGPGIHHVCLEVNDIDSFGDKFKQAGFEPVYDDPSPGSGGARINFLHPNDTFGVLLELREKPS